MPMAGTTYVSVPWPLLIYKADRVRQVVLNLHCCLCHPSTAVCGLSSPKVGLPVLRDTWHTVAQQSWHYMT
jgi:hypothetical protein